MSACTVWRSNPIPPEGDHIKVPHARHAAAKVDCIVCHEEMWDQKSLGERVLPSEDKCMECHRDKKDAGKCDMCHTDVSKAKPWPKAEPTLILNHSKHIERTKEKCEVCHQQLPNPVRTTDMKPLMSSCTGCHNHKDDYNQARCQQCHTDLARYSLEPTSFFSHQGNWLKEHPQAARSTPEACATCHDQTFCKDCHSASTVAAKPSFIMPERLDREFMHKNDFLGRHSVEAKADPVSCQRCHGQSFCNNCHQQQNLTPLGSDPRNPHPAGWSFPGSPDFHGPAARRDIASCAACHDQGARSICVDCHKVGGIGGNPHPPGWNHSRGEISGNGMCLVCHL